MSRGQLLLALVPTVANGKIVALEVVASPDRLRKLHLGIAPEPDGASD